MNPVKHVWLLLLAVGLHVHAAAPQQDEFCGLRNGAFMPGEQLTYQVYYSIIGIYVNAGTAVLDVGLERLNNKPVYHITGIGKSNSSYDWVMDVNDRYETYMDTATLKPLRFVRNVHEGNHNLYENVSFNHTARTAVTNKGVYKVPPCVQDVVSALYYARNINFAKYKKGDRISFAMFLDNEVYNMYVKFDGREDVKTRYGKFRAIRLKPLLLKSSVFEGGEKMTIWVTDDANRIPVRIESAISVGSVKVDMMGYRNLRYPLSSLIRLR